MGNRLVLVNISTYFSLISEPNSQPKIIVEEMPEPVLAVKELVVSHINRKDLEYHPFGQLSVVLIVSYLWKVGFYSL